jgi:hypothetical protein
MNERSKNLEGQKINETVILDDNTIVSGQLKTKVDVYPLKESDYEILVNQGGGFKGWATRFIYISLGGLILLIAKTGVYFYTIFISTNKNDVDWDIEDYEWISVLISFGFFVLLLVLGFIFKNKKDKLIKKMKKYFNFNKSF